MEGAAASVKAEKTEDNLVTYPGIFENTDLQCRVHGEGLKEDIILPSPEAVREEYAMLYQMTEVTPVLENNCVHFLDTDGEEVFCVHAPCMRDAAGQKTEAILLKSEREYLPHYISPESDVAESPGTYLPSCDRPGNNYIKESFRNL